MGCDIRIDDRGMGTIGIADADGEIHDYRIRLAPRGLSVFAVELTRTDTGNSYLVRVLHTGKWECECPAEKYRKRGADHCKHIGAMTSYRAFWDEQMKAFMENGYVTRIAS